MKHILLTTIAAVVLVGCGEAQQSTTPAEAKPVEPVGEAATPELPTAKPPDISIREAVKTGNIEAVKQHLDAGADVNEVAAGLIKRIKVESHILQGIVDKPAWEEWKALNVALDAVATRVAQEYDLPA